MIMRMITPITLVDFPRLDIRVDEVGVVKIEATFDNGLKAMVLHACRVDEINIVDDRIPGVSIKRGG